MKLTLDDLFNELDIPEEKINEAREELRKSTIVFNYGFCKQIYKYIDGEWKRVEKDK